MGVDESKKGIPVIEIPGDEQPHLDSICQWIFTQTGLNYPPKKHCILYSRLQTLAWRLGLPGIKEINRLLQEPGAERLAAEVARVVSTNYTFFFREFESLDFFRRQILPSLPDNEKCRIWSAAAASGEEAYSIAILLAEELGLIEAARRAAILGTDISYPMIDQAEKAVYQEQRVDALPNDIRNRYFEACDAEKWRVISSIRQMCTFRRMNLMSTPWPFRQPFHIIFCRNIFYYFDKTQQMELVERLYDAAAPESWLITSVTETFYSMPIRWQRVIAGVWRKSGG